MGTNAVIVTRVHCTMNLKVGNDSPDQTVHIYTGRTGPLLPAYGMKIFTYCAYKTIAPDKRSIQKIIFLIPPHEKYVVGTH